jgi:hypothetical protein
VLSFNKHVFFSGLAVVLLAIIVCFRFFGDIILHPDEFLFGPDGDGLKNYFSVAYQVIHGQGLWFNGMLYPYGDHLIFADGQPLLTKVLSWLIEPDVKNGPQIIGIMNLLMIGSLVITAWCVHRLLVWNNVNPWFALPFALTIGFLSPQLARITGHYALAYTFFVPMSWLLIESINRYKQTWLAALVTAVFVLLSAFIHPYYLFVFLVFLGATIGWEILINKFQFGKVKNLLARAFVLLAPVIVFMIYQHSVDLYTDRPESPAGVMKLMTTFQSVFFPVSQPFYGLFNSYFFRIFIPSSWEGHAYIGMVASFTAFTSVFVFVKRAKIRKWKILTHPVLPIPLKTAFIPAVLTLLLAMGVFHLLGLQWLSNYIAPLKQFRSLGRLAWVFYYVFSVWTVYHLYVLWRHFRSINAGKYTYHISVIVALCAFLWMLDAIVNIKARKAHMLTRNATESFSDYYATQWSNAGINIDDYQAIMPLPLILIGSEKIGLEKGRASLKHSMKGSFSTGLPIIGGAMSRTSKLVTEKTAQLVANPLLPRTAITDFEADKKILLLWSYEELSAVELKLANSSSVVYQNNEYRLYSIAVSELSEMQIKPELDSVTISKEAGYLLPKLYSNTDDKLWENAAYRVEKSTALVDTVFTKQESLILSYWVKVIQTDELLPNRSFLVDGERQFSSGIGVNPNLLDGWLMVTDTLNTEAGKRHEYLIKSRAGTIGRIQLRKANTYLIHKEDSLTFVNNIPLR